MARKRKGSKKERQARQKLLSEPWWKLMDPKLVLSTIAVMLLMIGLVAVN